MTEPITIDGKQYQAVTPSKHMDTTGCLVLRPLPKQPEAEKKRYYVVVHEIGGDYLLDSKYEWTRKQAQLAADAVKEVLRYIQEDIDNWTNLHEAVEEARDAMKGESDEQVQIRS